MFSKMADAMITSVILTLFCSLGFALGDCEHGWHRHGNYCFLFSSDIQDWSTAQKSCQSQNAHLAEPNSRDESMFLKSTANAVGKLVDYWLGGQDRTSEGRWKWSSTGKAVTHSNWGRGQPDNEFHQEDCMEMNIWMGWEWNDDECSNRHHYICQKDLPNEGATDILG